MLRVTPIYGSRWEDEGPASIGSCTLVEYADVKVLVNVGGPVIDYDWQSQLPEHDCGIASLVLSQPQRFLRSLCDLSHCQNGTNDALRSSCQH
jgi:hypothetical protein